MALTPLQTAIEGPVAALWAWCSGFVPALVRSWLRANLSLTAPDVAILSCHLAGISP